MRRRNRRSETGETLGKTGPRLDFHFPDPSGSPPGLDLKGRKRVTFAGVDNRSPSNDPPEARAERSFDAKTSEYAFFKKLKSDCNHRLGSKMSNNVEQSSKMSESSAKTRGTKDQVKDERKSFSFSTPVETARHEKNLKRCSPVFRPMCSGDNNTRPGGIPNQTGDVFSIKRKKLHQWVRDIWFPDITELSSSGCDLVPVLLTRLFPETEDKQVREIPKERVDRVKKPKFLDSPGSKFLNRLRENYTEVQQRPHRENGGSIFWVGWPEESIAPSLQFPTAHVHSSFTLRDPEEISFAISYPTGDSVYRPSFSKQKALAQFSVEETPSCPISSPWFRSYKPLSPIYHREKETYRAENLFHEREEPTLLLEWDTVSRRNTDDLPLGYQTNLITYPNVSSSSGIDNPWNSEACHDLDTKELYSLPLLSYNSPDSFPFPITNPTNHFEHEPERHNFEENALHTFHHVNSSDVLTREPGYYHQLSYSPVKHYSLAYQTIEAPGYDIISLPSSSPSYANLLEAPSPRGTNGFKSRDWSQALID